MDHTDKPLHDQVLVPLRCDSLNGIVKHDTSTSIIKSSHDNSDIENRIESGVMSKDSVAINNHVLSDVANVEDGEGSEAETVVLPGKSSDTISSKKTIRHDGNGTNVTNGDGTAQRVTASTISESTNATKNVKSKGQAQEGTTLLTEKRSDKNNGLSTSSHNSPSATSPSISLHDQPQDHQHNSRSRATSESARSRQDNNGTSKPASNTVPRKRKVSIDGIEDKSVKRRIKREENDSTSSIDSKRHISSARSESPTRQRTSTGSANSPSITKPRRKPPAPLVVNSGGKRKHSIDGDSNDSQSPKHSAHSKLSHVVDPEMLKKRRDKNGRTRVARACAANNIDELREHLRDHPEELDEPDNAGNTPLQIASLEGSTDIVKLLLKKGCKVDTENVDKDSPLIDSVENSHLAVVKLLLEAGVNPRKLNNKGEEPSELVDLDHEDGPAIKEELTKYRIKYDSKRRQSTEKGPDTGRDSVAVKSPRGSPSLNARSPPPQTSRRRAGRSEATRNDLLWITATPENLINFAGKGDEQAIMHLLNMRPVSDVEAVIAAAKGGHDSCLNLLLAIGETNPDPAPLEDQRKGFNTPMLAAIGKGNLRVIELLLDQPLFDPTKRPYKNYTYYELAEKRQGDGWKEEYRKLKTAYDERMGRDGKKHSSKNSRTSSPKDLKKTPKDRSPSSITTRETSPSASKTVPPRKRLSNEVKPEKSRDKTKDKETDVKVDRTHLKVPKRESREGSNAVSDREMSPMVERDRKSASDQEALPKPRKRLVSGRDIKAQRRNSLVSTVSTSSAPDSIKIKSSPDESSKTKRLEVDERKDKKRIRRSASPQPSDAAKSSSSTVKRPRVEPDTPANQTGGTAQIASTTRSVQSSNTAPTALMSSSSAAKDTKTASKNPTSSLSSKQKPVKTDSEEKSKIKSKEKSKSELSNESDKKKPKESKIQDLPQPIETKEPLKDDSETPSTSQIKQELIESPTKEHSTEIGAKIIPSPSFSPEDSSVMDTSVDPTPTESKTTIDDTQQIITVPTVIDPVVDEMSNEKKRERDEEEAAEEAERHKRRREDEEVSRRRAAQEQKQRQERESYLNTLPKVFRDLFEHPEQAKSHKELQTWSRLRCAKGCEIDPGCSEPERDELWVTNFQVAAILVESDLEMSHYTSWTRKPLVDPVKSIVWRAMRATIHRWCVYDSVDIKHGNHILESYDAGVQCENKFLALKSFWIKLSDFEGVISRYPHLQGFKYEISNLPTVQTYRDLAKEIDKRDENTPSNSAWRNLPPTPRTSQSPLNIDSKGRKDTEGWN